MNKTVARWPKWHARYKKSLATVQVLFVELGNNGAAPKRVAVVGIDLQVFKLPEAKNGFVWSSLLGCGALFRPDGSFHRLARDYERLPE